VLESYRAMLAFRRGSAALRDGRTRFFDTVEPVLAFQRGEGVGALLCLFNLSPLPTQITLEGADTLVGPSQAVALAGGLMRLGPNAVAFLPVTGPIRLG